MGAGRLKHERSVTNNLENQRKRRTLFVNSLTMFGFLIRLDSFFGDFGAPGKLSMPRAVRERRDRVSVVRVRFPDSFQRRTGGSQDFGKRPGRERKRRRGGET